MYTCIASFSQYRLGTKIEDSVYNSLTSFRKKSFVKDEDDFSQGVDLAPKFDDGIESGPPTTAEQDFDDSNEL